MGRINHKKLTFAKLVVNLCTAKIIFYMFLILEDIDIEEVTAIKFQSASYSSTAANNSCDLAVCFILQKLP